MLYIADTDVQLYPHRYDSKPPTSIKIEHFRGDITDKALVAEVMAPKAKGQKVAVFHLASIMSAQVSKRRGFRRCIIIFGTKQAKG